MGDRVVARADGVLVEELDDGVVLYDERCGQAHWLDARAAAVWRACQKPRRDAEVAQAAGVDELTCQLLLDDLTQRDLVRTAGEGYSRRVVLRTAARVGLGGAVAAPIVSAIIPVAAAHASTSGSGGTGGNGGGTLQTLTLESGNAAPAILKSTDDLVRYYGTTPATPPQFGGAFHDAAVVTRNPAWHAPINTSQWIAYDSNGAMNENEGYYIYLRQFTVPSNATGATISGTFLSDDESTVYVNGVVLDSSTPGDSFGTPASFTASLTPGQLSTLEFQVHNDPNPNANPSGLDYSATISYYA